MPNGTTAPTAPATTPATGRLDVGEYQRKIQEAAARTRDVGETALPAALKGVTVPGAFGSLGQAAVQNWERQAADLRKRAERAATGLEMTGTAALQGIQNLETIQETVRGQVQSATETWGAAAEKADEYVQAARSRVGEVLGKLDDIHQDIGQRRDFAKAHAMQAAVQATTGSMRTEERNIAQNYGVDSPEYAQFQQSKRTTLARIQSNIETNYRQLAEAQDTAFLQATTEAYTKSNMYVGFQEQQHVEMLKYRDTSRNQYALQAAQLDVGIEQLKMEGMENLANWLIETPTFSMDATPLITMLADMTETAESLRQAEAATRAATRGAGGGGGGGRRAARPAYGGVGVRPKVGWPAGFGMTGRGGF